MDATLSLLDLAGAVALLLWAMHMIQSGIQRAFGADLRRVLAHAFGNRIKAFAAGIGVTAVLQSSTATGLMVAGFAAAGLVDLVPALAVMLGANVGTTLIVQLLSFDIALAAPVFLIIGVMMFRRSGESRTRDIGRVAIGLGLLLMALSQLVQIITPYEDVPSLRMLLGAVATQPFVALLLGALATWAAHSSVAIVLIVMSFVANGAVSLDTGIALVLGANIGSAINPLLEAPRGVDRTGAQVALGNLLNRLIGAAIALPLIERIGPALVRLDPSLARDVANFHMFFNVVMALVFLPLLPLFAKALRRLLPQRVEAQDPSRPLYLDPAAAEAPAVALGNATREALRMVDVFDEMLQGFGRALDEKTDKQRIVETRRIDDILDRLNTAIRSYIVGLDPESLTEDDDKRAAAILAFTSNLEQAGDTIDRGALATLTRQLKRGLVLADEGRADARLMLEHLSANLRLAATVFMTQDLRAARALADEKAFFREIESKATAAYFRRLRQSRPDAIEANALHLDLLRALKGVNDCLVAGAAYPVLEERGELRSSRLRSQQDSDLDS
ncbi:Na/Pi cotransporter [Methylovirgula ligni]|uniref:Phosphate:Na+ symporter n=1 Tax=Methylovirgula ligni TaxID=569860 RepID=A0A3D9Z1D0_9HYPH|nr:Na/Pi cotransporter family protein [Methylovirgula ligni]QAY95646.1 Na/Pi cotransporter [Methylovirgula ligni]REF88994.1 phosphate:Na+ symporter [Methylovirgula ligni]